MSRRLGQLACAIEERQFSEPALACLAILLGVAFAPIATGQSWNVGFQETRVADSATGREFPVAFWYPTDRPEEKVMLGPAELSVSLDGDPAESIAGLVLISHGFSGSNLGHSDTARFLAAERRGTVGARIRAAFLVTVLDERRRASADLQRRKR